MTSVGCRSSRPQDAVRRGPQAYTGVRPQQVSSSPARELSDLLPDLGAHHDDARHAAEARLPQVQCRRRQRPGLGGSAAVTPIDNPFVLVVFGLLIAGVGYVLLALGIPRLRRRRARTRAVRPVGPGRPGLGRDERDDRAHRLDAAVLERDAPRVRGTSGAGARTFGRRARGTGVDGLGSGVVRRRTSRGRRWTGPRP